MSAVIRARPLVFGFVLPRAFIRSRKFAGQRKRIEELYGEVEVAELPNRIFRASGVESALVVARDLDLEAQDRHNEFGVGRGVRP